MQMLYTVCIFGQKTEHKKMETWTTTVLFWIKYQTQQKIEDKKIRTKTEMPDGVYNVLKIGDTGYSVQDCLHTAQYMHITYSLV